MRNVLDCRRLLVILFVGALTLDSAFANDVPQSFTLDGQLFRDTAGTLPLVDSSIGFKIQILDQDQVCVLYEEQQNVNTATSQGYFSAQVGSAVGSPRRTVGDSANTMASVFQNINAVTGKLLSNGAACSAAALAGNRRFVRIAISPPTMGGAERILSPNLTLDSVPNAVVAERAESIQGFRSSDLLKVNTASGAMLSQTNLESLFSSVSRFNSLTAVVDGTSSSYVQSSTGGARLPVLTGAPTSPNEGAIWFDTTDDRLKYYDGSAPISIGTGSGSVSSVGFTAPAELSVSGAPVTSSGTIAVTWASQTANRVLASPNGSAGAPSFRALVAADAPFAVQNLGGTPSLQSGTDAAKGAAATAGRVWIATDTRFIYRDTGTVWETIGDGGGGGPTGTAGGDLDGTYPNPTVDGLQGVAISAVAPVDGQVLRYTSTGTQWAAANFSAADLRTAGGAAQFASATCAATQTTTWSSLTNTFTCIDIAGLAASTITSGTIDIARLPAAVQYWTAATGGINYAGGNVGIGTTTPNTQLDITGAFSQRGMAAPAASVAGQGRIYFDSTANKFRVSENNGAYTDLVGSGGVGGSGTTGTIPKFTAASTLGNSLLSESGTLVTVGGRGLIKPAADSSTAFEIQKANGTPMFTVDTTATTSNVFNYGTVNSGYINSGGMTDAFVATNDAAATTGTGAAIGFNASGGSPMAQIGAAWSAGANTNSYISFSNKTSGTVSEKVRIASTGNVGIGTTAPNTILDINGAFSQRGMAAPATSVAGQGRIYFDSTANKFRVSENNGAYTDLVSAGGGGALSSLTAATAANAINNLNFAQTWNWSTATTQSPLSISANALTSGSLLSLTTSSASVNSTSGLLNVANTGASTNGMVARIQSNSTAGSGLTVLANGNVGIGTTTPTEDLEIAGKLKLIDSSNWGDTIHVTNGFAGTSATAEINLMNNTSSEAMFGVGSTSHTNLTLRNRAYMYSEGGAGISLLANNASSDIRMMTGGNNERLRIDNAGNVGIGTTSPSKSLDIVRNQAANTGISISNSNTTFGSSSSLNMSAGAQFIEVGVNGPNTNFSMLNSGDAFIQSGGSSLAFWQNSVAPIRFINDSTETMRLVNGGNVGIGTTAPGARLDNAGSFALSGDISPATITANTNDYAPASLSSATILRLSTDASRDLTGITGGVDGRVLQLINVGANNIVLRNDVTSTAANRFLIGSDLTIAANQSATLVYDSTTSRWRVSGTTGSGGAGGSFLPLAGGTMSGGLNMGGQDITNTGAIITNDGTAIGRPGATITTWNGFISTETAFENNGGAGSFSLRDTASSASDPAYSFSGDYGNGMFRAASNSVGFSTNTIERVRINSTGNVGVGTTAPLVKLDARGASAKATTAALAYISQAASTDAAGPLAVRTGVRTHATAANRYGAIEVDDNGTKRDLVLQPSGGSVGIGVNPISWIGTNSLSVFGDIAAGNSAVVIGNTGVYMNGGFGQEIWWNNNVSIANDSVSGTDLVFETNSLERLRIMQSGNVGIGTAAPGAMLQLGTAGTSLGTFRMTGSTSGYVQLQPAAAAGSWTMTLPSGAGSSGQVLTTNGSGVTSWTSVPTTGGTFLAADGSETVPSYSFSNDPNTGMFSNSADEIGFATNGSRRVTLSANGLYSNVTLNYWGNDSTVYTSTSASENTPLGPANEINNQSSTAGSISYLRLAAGNGAARAYIGAVNPASGNSPAIVIGQRTGANAYAERMRISESGNVGIGTTTPTATFHASSSANALYVPIINALAPNLTAGNSSYIGFGKAESAADSASISFYNAGTGSNNNRIDFGFWGGPGRMSVLAGGNVGIGTSSPSEKLEVAGNVRAVAGQIVSAVYNNGTGTTFNFNNGNSQYTTAACQGMSLSNMQDGGSYTIAVKSTSGACSFTHTGLTPRYAGGVSSVAITSHTVFSFARMGTDLYITWVTF